jgi:hypothetical protein
MPIRNETSTRFTDEMRIISPWAYFLAFLGFVSMVVVLVVIVGRDQNAPPLAVRWLLGIITGALLSFYIVLIGYVNGDAGRRGMSRLLWTLVAVFVPSGMGIVLYFVLRKPRTTCCPQCGAPVEPGFGFCPKCRYHLQPVCPHCQRGVNPGDKFCPYCGGSLEGVASSPSSPAPSQP